MSLIHEIEVVPMETYTKIIEDVSLPKMLRVKQSFPHPRVTNIADEITKGLSIIQAKQLLKPGHKIAITAGSRGITDIDIVTKFVVDYCKEAGSSPFVFPAMGSHGGATAEGQKRILEDYKISEASMGCPIKASMDVVAIGQSISGLEVYIDKYASEADGIIVIGRIKPHTAFTGNYESGLMKMLAIGLGKQYGAEMIHSRGSGQMAELIPEIGKHVLQNSPILFGIGIIENAYDETAEIHVLRAQEIISEEPKLLNRAKSLMGSLQFPEVDVLIVDKIGKNFSGDGADPNITGAFLTPYKTGGIKAKRRVVLDLSDETHGNAQGVGSFDTTTQRLFVKMSFSTTYPNAITCLEPSGAKIPMVLKSDRDAIATAIKTACATNPENPRIIRIENTKDIQEIWISEALVEEAQANPNITFMSEAESFPFNFDGNLW